MARQARAAQRNVGSAYGTKSAILDEIAKGPSRAFNALERAAPALQADKEVVLAAVAQYGAALQFAASALQADKEVVLAAVAQNGDALQHAAPALRADPAFQSLAAAKTTIAELRAAMQQRDERLAAAEITIAELRAAAQLKVVDLTADGGAKPPPKRRRVAASGRHLCVVCDERPLSVVCLPCRHFSLCATCVQDERATAGGCPMCRAAITELISVYQ